MMFAVVLLASAASAAAEPTAADPAEFIRTTLGLTEYEIASADLNGDGRLDFAIRDLDPSRCGMDGCPLYVIEAAETAFHTRLNGVNTHVPVLALETQSNGWKNLSVRAGGVDRPVSTFRLRFDGLAYGAMEGHDDSNVGGDVLFSDVIAIPF